MMKVVVPLYLCFFIKYGFRPFHNNVFRVMASDHHVSIIEAQTEPYVIDVVVGPQFHSLSFRQKSRMFSPHPGYSFPALIDLV